MSISQQNTKLKQLFQKEQYQECADFAIQLLENNSKDKNALLFLAQSQIRLNALQECQDTLNDLYKCLKPGVQADDTILIVALRCNEQCAVKMQELPNQKQRKIGRDSQIRIKFNIIDYFDKKQKYDEMLTHTESYCLLLMEESRCKEIEETYVWLLNHQGITPQQRLEYGSRIYEIDSHYNPYTPINELFTKLTDLNAEPSQLQPLAIKFFEGIETKPFKKTLGSALRDQDPNKALRDFTFFADDCIRMGSLAFTKTEVIFKNKAFQRHFARYLSVNLLKTTFLSAEWDKIEQRIVQLLQTEFCKKTEFDIDQNPLQVYLQSILISSKFVRETRVPKFSETWFSALPLARQVDALTLLSKEYSEMSQYANLCFAVVALSADSPMQIDGPTILAKLNQSKYIARSASKHKISPAKTGAELLIYLDCCSLLIKDLPQDQANHNQTQCQIDFDKQGQFCSQQLQEYYNQITVDKRWRQSLSEGKWLDAIAGLDKLGESIPSKQAFATYKKTEIQIQNLSEICKEEEEQNLFLKGAFNQLQSCKEVSAENLLLQGYLLWTYQLVFNQDKDTILKKWLSALKKDQTNPQIYYSLAVHYFLEKDILRASRCLDKVLLLAPDHEQALLLQYFLLQTNEQRLQLLNKFMESNWNTAVTYFLKGLVLHQQLDFVNAIDHFRNAIKFYNIQRGKPQPKHLIPHLQLPIHENPFGIYGEANAAICEVYLSECYLKLERPSDALKHFSRGIEEIAKIKHPASCFELQPDIKEILEVLQFDKFVPNPVMMQNEPVLQALQGVEPSKWVLECLMLGSRLVSNPQISISILNVALRCEPNQSILMFILTELLSRMTVIIEQQVVFENGQIQLLPDAPKVIERVEKILQISAQSQFQACQNLQKKRINALFAIALRTQELQRFKQCLTLAAELYERREMYPGWSTLVLDYAKIIHEYQRFDSSGDQLQKVKIQLIKQALVQAPHQSNLWVHLHIFSTDKQVRAGAIFKAYELDPENAFVQEHILKYYLQTQQWTKAFKIILKSYQRAINAQEAQHPVVLATLAYFNAVTYFETGSRQNLLEALSLIRLVQREDMKQLLAEIYVYLSHYNGDYLQTLNFLQTKQDEQYVPQLLLKAQLGLPMYSYTQTKEKAEALNLSRDLLTQVFQIESAPDNFVQSQCELYISSFISNPADNAPFLQLYQEMCLKRKLVPKENLLDHPQIKEALTKLSIQHQRNIIIQCLRLLNLRDGEVKEAKQIVDAKKGETYVRKDEKSYTDFIVKVGGLKPQNITTNQYKALLRAYFLAKRDPKSLEGPIEHGVEINVKEQARHSGLKHLIKMRKEEADFGLNQLMRDPLSIAANTKWLWSLLRQGKVKEAQQAFKLVKQRVEIGLLQGNRAEYDKISKFMSALTDEKEQDDSRLVLVAALCRNLRGVTDAVEVDLKEVACSIARIIAGAQSQSQIELVKIVFQSLSLVLAEQGFQQVYNKLVKEILNYTTVSSVSPHIKNLVWHYQLLSTASSLLSLKKTTQVLPLCKEVEQISRKGTLRRSLFPEKLMRARTQLHLNNLAQVSQTLAVDEASIERDFLLALVQFNSQDYKQYYLICLGLVAGAKTMDNNQWALAYSYYLKAFAEMTFLAAKRRGIKLKDDFDDETHYSMTFFEKKAKTSLEKCLICLESVGERESILARAVEQMLKQV